MITILTTSKWKNGADNELDVDYFRVYQDSRIRSKIATMLNGTPGWGKVPENTVDGDVTTHAIATTSFWDLQVDLRKTYNVDRIIFTPHPSNWATAYSIQVKGETGDWSTVKYVNGAGNTPQTHSFASPIEARYIKLDVTAKSNTHPLGHAVREVQVFGTRQ